MIPYAEEKLKAQTEIFESAVEEKDEDLQPQPKYVEIEDYSEDEDIDISFDAVDDTPVAKEPSTNEVLSKLAELIAGKTPAPATPEAPKRPGIPTVDLEAVRKTFNDQLHESEDPFTVAMQATQQVFGGQIAQQARVIQELKKEVLKNDPDKAYVFKTYNHEVETIVASLPADQQNHPDVYDYAVNQVMLKHIGDIVTRKAEEIIAGKAPARVSPGAVRTVGQTNGAQPVKKRKVQATRTDEAMAQRYGMSLRDYLMTRGKI